MLFAPVAPGLDAAIQRYFDVLYECNLDKFDRLFHPACHLFTVINGVEQGLSLATYRDVIAKRPSPKSLGSTSRWYGCACALAQRCSRITSILFAPVETGSWRQSFTHSNHHHATRSRRDRSDTPEYAGEH
jgi:hypothetical protein